MPEVKKDYRDNKDHDAKAKMESEQFRKIFVGGLTYSTTEDMLKDYYQRYGEVVDVIIMRDNMTKRSRGFGFVTFARSNMVDECMTNRPHTIDGKTVEPKRAIPKEEASQKPESGLSVKKLYVSGIKDDHTEDMLRDYFKDFGVVFEVSIMMDKATGKPRGFAFVLFEDYDAVDKACLQKSHFIGGKRCDVKKALTKDEMKKVEQQERDKKNREFQTRGDGGFQNRLGAGGGGSYRNGRDNFGTVGVPPGGGGGGYDSRPWNAPATAVAPGGGGGSTWGTYGNAPPAAASAAPAWNNPIPTNQSWNQQQPMYNQPPQAVGGFDSSKGYVSRSSSGVYNTGVGAGGAAPTTPYGGAGVAPVVNYSGNVPGAYGGNVSNVAGATTAPYGQSAPTMGMGYGGGVTAPQTTYDWQQQQQQIQQAVPNQARPALGGWVLQGQGMGIGQQQAANVTPGVAPSAVQQPGNIWCPPQTAMQQQPQQQQQPGPGAVSNVWTQNPVAAAQAQMGHPPQSAAPTVPGGGMGMNVGMNPAAGGYNQGGPPGGFNQPAPQISQQQNWGAPQAWGSVPPQQVPYGAGLYR